MALCATQKKNRLCQQVADDAKKDKRAHRSHHIDSAKEAKDM
jgi:hypothetical protein